VALISLVTFSTVSSKVSATRRFPRRRFALDSTSLAAYSIARFRIAIEEGQLGVKEEDLGVAEGEPN